MEIIEMHGQGAMLNEVNIIEQLCENYKGIIEHTFGGKNWEDLSFPFFVKKLVNFIRKTTRREI